MSGFLNNFWRWLREAGAGGSQPTADEPTESAMLVPAQLSAPELTTAVVGRDPRDQLALLTVSGRLRDAMLACYREQWAKSGSLVSNGGKVAPGTILSVVGAAGGSVGLSTAMSGQLFIATANPATLMAIKGGVGSAVVGAGGSIIGQAPFIAASSAIVPVVAPLIVFQAISTFMVMKQFALVRKDIARVERALERVLHRTEATFASELVAISQRLESLEEQFADERQFSTDMIVRLALAEERVNALSERYKMLNGSQDIAVDASEVDLDFKLHDSRLAVIASSMGLRVGYLRLALSLQESPARTGRLVENFVGLCDQHDKLLKAIRREGRKTSALVKDLDGAVESMSWYQNNMPGWLLGRRSERIESENASEKLQQVRERQLEVERREVSAAENLGLRARNAISGSEDLALIYWKDELGEHSYYVEGLPYEVTGLEPAKTS